MSKKILVIILFIAMFLLCTSSSMAYPLSYSGEPLIDKSQAEQYLKDRHASKKMLNCLDFIYDYAEEVGIDPSEIVAMSAIETGFGKSHLFVAYNNPGGIKSSHTSNGWAHYKTAKDGYKGMINLLATYDGLINKKSYLYGLSKTTEGLAGIYWTNYGNDLGYHKQLSKVIETMRSYPIKKTKAIKKQEIIKQENPKKIIKKSTNKPVTTKKRTGIDIIYDILNKDDSNSGYDYIMNFLK